MVAIKSDMTVTKQQHHAVLYVAPKERLLRKFTLGSSVAVQCFGFSAFSTWVLSSIPGGGQRSASPLEWSKKKNVTNKKKQKSLSNSSYCLVCPKVFYCNSFEIEAADISKWQTMESQCFLLFTKTNTVILSGQKVPVNKIIRQSTSCISFNTMNFNQ